MKKTIIICGLIAGLIVTSWMIMAMAGFFKNAMSEGGMLLGYTTMLVAFSMIYVAIKNTRDKYNDGVISFGRAFKIGLVITLIASTIYVLVWMIDFYYFIPDYLDKYTAHMIAKMKADGATATAIQKATADAQSFSKMYKNPFVNAIYTYLEILPVGLLVTLVCAFILKRKQNANNVVLAN